ncbi:BTAD domain-containing putative transcriptional regulator [Kitasatospora sp. NPDC097691]|uniref:AfsR/SARP family transcriptional regulator n=1 Tax=Kitasatospora sp. NPDC097691 TaxID=3157231 RepID=UPI00332E6787
MSIEVDGTPRSVRGPKVRHLLALLLAAGGETVRTDRLVELLWEGHPPRTAVSSLHNHVNNLRKGLGPYGARLVSTSAGYRLVLEDGELDTVALTAAAKRVRAHHARQDWPSVTTEAEAALAAWGGEPFAEFPALAESPEAARLRETRLNLLEGLFAAGLATGRHRDLVADLTALAAEHPLREAFHAQLMLALHGSGRTAAAVEVHRRLRAALAEELGLDPGRSVQEAHQVILAADHATHRPAAGNTPARALSQLPRPVATFVGRRHELGLLTSTLARPHGAGSADADGLVPAVLISGMGGVGKTALALHAAHALRCHYSDGGLYADLNGFSAVPAREPHELLARFLTDLGIDNRDLPECPDDRAALFRATLAERRMLLVLDNARDGAQIAPLLPGSGQSGVIITSRRALAGRIDGVHIPLEPLGPESRDLLTAVCSQDRMAAEPDAAGRIIAACGGLPLALHLAAARIANRPNWPLSALADRLAESSRRLDVLAVHDTTVRTVFSTSYQALLDSNRAGEAGAAGAFRLLGTWPGHPLSLEAAAALLGEPLDVAFELLDVLVDAQILQSPSEQAFGFHDLVATYAAELAHTHETEHTRTAATDRLLTWYAAAVHRIGALCWPYCDEDEAPAASAPLPDIRSAEHALEWLRREMPAIREVVRRSIATGNPHRAVGIAIRLHGYGNSYWWDGHWHAIVDDALSVAPSCTDRKTVADLHGTLAVTHRQAGRHDQCLRHLNAAQDLYTADGDKRGLAAVLSNKSLLLNELGRLEEAFEAAHRANELHRQAEGRDSMLALYNLAGLYVKSGAHEEAEPIYRRVLQEFRRDNLPGPIAAALLRLGDTLRALGQQREALVALEEALAIAESIEAHAGMADALEQTARVHAHFGNPVAARDSWTRALSLARQAGITRVTTDSLKGLESLAALV